MPVNVDIHGYVETEKAALKHYAVRTKSQDSNYKPSVDDVAPRASGWKPKPKPGSDTTS